MTTEKKTGKLLQEHPVDKAVWWIEYVIRYKLFSYWQNSCTVALKIFKVLYKKHMKVKLMKQISEMEDRITHSSHSKAFYTGGHKEMSSILADLWRPRIWAQMRGGEGCGVSANEYSKWSPNKLWRSNSIFNLFFFQLYWKGAGRGGGNTQYVPNDT